MMRRFSIQKWFALIPVFAVMILSDGGTTHAATITVGASCTLALAIQEANITGSSGGVCSTGSTGSDTIILAGSATYELTAGPFSSVGNNALPSIDTTIVIEGNGATITRVAPDSQPFRFFYVSPPGNLTLNAVTITNGRAQVYGGAIYNLGHLTITNSRIDNNTAVIGVGGAIMNTNGGQVTIENSTFAGNYAYERGGVIFNEVLGSLVTIDRSTFGGVIGNRSGSGGAIASDSKGNVLVTNSLFGGNISGIAGAIYNGNGTTIIDNTIIGGPYPNVTTNWDGGGAWNNINGTMIIRNGSKITNNRSISHSGALFNSGTLTIDASEISGNEATVGSGGAIYNDLEGSITVQNGSKISDNISMQAGGGIFNYGILIVDASTFSGNSAVFDGGAIWTGSNTDPAYPARVTIRNHSQIINNVSQGKGGGIYNHLYTGSSTITISDSILMGNRAAEGGNAFHNQNSTSQQTITNSCISGHGDTSVVNLGGVAVDARTNWWGASDGPSGAFGGSGDSVSTNVNALPFLSIQPAFCPGSTAPTANNDVYATNEDTNLAVAATNGVLGNDTPGSLTAEIATPPDAGTLILNADGSFSYTPLSNFNGVDSFTYRAVSGAVRSSPATATISVIAVNDAPLAVDDTVATPHGMRITIPVLANDSDVDGDSLNISAFTSAAHGQVSVNDDQTMIYLPDADFSGSDQFTYTVSDGHGGLDTATVTISVMPPPENRPPVATDDTFTILQGTTLISSVAELLSNDVDPDGDPLEIVAATPFENGMAFPNPDGSVVYTPAPTFTGTVTATYTISDGRGGTDTAVVTVVVVSSLNHPPVAVDDGFVIPEGSILTTTVAALLSNDYDPDGDPISIIDGLPFASGQAVVNPDGSVIYTPEPGFTGTVTTLYKVSDGRGGTATAFVSVTITSQES